MSPDLAKKKLCSCCGSGDYIVTGSLVSWKQGENAGLSTFLSEQHCFDSLPTGFDWNSAKTLQQGWCCKKQASVEIKQPGWGRSSKSGSLERLKKKKEKRKHTHCNHVNFGNHTSASKSLTRRGWPRPSGPAGSSLRCTSPSSPRSRSGAPPPYACHISERSETQKATYLQLNPRRWHPLCAKQLARGAAHHRLSWRVR